MERISDPQGRPLSLVGLLAAVGRAFGVDPERFEEQSIEIVWRAGSKHADAGEPVVVFRKTSSKMTYERLDVALPRDLLAPL